MIASLAPPPAWLWLGFRLWLRFGFQFGLWLFLLLLLGLWDCLTLCISLLVLWRIIKVVTPWVVIIIIERVFFIILGFLFLFDLLLFWLLLSRVCILVLSLLLFPLILLLDKRLLGSLLLRFIDHIVGFLLDDFLFLLTISLVLGLVFNDRSWCLNNRSNLFNLLWLLLCFFFPSAPSSSSSSWAPARRWRPWST